MIVAVFVLVAVVLLEGAILAEVWLQHRGVIRDRLRRRAVFTLKDGTGVSGVLYETDARTFVVREATATDGRETAAVDGELLVLREDVHYIQIP